ncbi:MAG: glycosyltransferase family 4 protein [Bacteroidetes bacterium]|nr:glycosyltransferase family 4 protein [Bacteroidota bacterium]
MKVLFIASGNSQNKVVPFVKSQADSLINAGIELDFYLVVGKGIGGYLSNLKPLRKKIKENNYNVLHSHYSYMGLLTILTFTNKYRVLSLMGSDVYPGYNSVGKPKNFKWILNYILLLVICLFTDKIIVKSKNILKFIPFKNKTEVIPNGVNFEKFKPSSGFLGTDRNVLFLGDILDSRKNFTLAKNAFDNFNDGQWQLLTPYPIDPNFVPSVLNSARILICTSLNEGSPNIIKEAMACNIPIVSTKVGDVEEVIGKTEGCNLSSFDAMDFSLNMKKSAIFNSRTQGRNHIAHLDEKEISKKLLLIYNNSIICKFN